MTLWCDEVFEGNMRFGLKLKRTLFVEQSQIQHIAVVETERLGKALLLDGCWMTSQGDERFYHEMIVQPAMLTAQHIARVLVIGGGDGGTAREILRHREVQHVDLVEIDGLVIEASQRYLPEIGQSAWSDPRLHVHVADGQAFVKDAPRHHYDVIIIDGADPIGPAAGLFEKGFFQACARCLNPHGVFVAQCESPTMFTQIHLATIQATREIFGRSFPYYGNVMLYPGGLWSWILASQHIDPRQALHEDRLRAIEAQLEVYNQEIHTGAFAMPNFIKRGLAAATTQS